MSTEPLVPEHFDKYYGEPEKVVLFTPVMTLDEIEKSIEELRLARKDLDC